MKAIFLDIDGVIATPTSVRLNYLLGRGPDRQRFDTVSLAYLQRLVTETGAVCPKCGKKVIEKRSRRGFVFYGCEGWPDCDFSTWDKPTGEKCTKCGKSLFKKKGGVLACLDESCGFEKKAERKKKEDKADA